MPLYLIRHAHAGNRGGWEGDDGSRPLSNKGRRQATAIEHALAGATITRVVSSPATRCVETVEPLATARGLSVEVDPNLVEGTDPDTCVDALLSPPVDGVALCSHGDLIPKLIRRFLAEGMRTADPNVSQKGSVWVLELNGGRVTTGHYDPPAED